MSGNDITVTMDPQNPPALSDDQKAELEALKAKTDAEIDTTDIPELSDDFWRKAVQNPFLKSNNALITVRKRR